MRRRRMVRGYADRPLPDGLVDELAAAALRAPSAGFTQAVSVLICQSETDRESFWSAAAPEGRALAGGNAHGPGAAAGLDERAGLPGSVRRAGQGMDRSRPCPLVGSVLVGRRGHGEHADLAGCGRLGPRSQLLRIPTDRIPAIRAAFDIPDEQLSVGVISAGYPDPAERPSGSARRRPRKTRAQLIHRGRWS